MKTDPTMTMAAAGPLLATLVLTGCGRPADDVQTARNDADTAVVQRQSTAAAPTDASREAAQAARDAADATKRAAEDVKAAAKNAADQATNKVSDALITTAVNAELAKDPTLSSLNIDVDTQGGRVALRGTVADQAAKQRASQLASHVEGVLSVDNQLAVADTG